MKAREAAKLMEKYDAIAKERQNINAERARLDTLVDKFNMILSQPPKPSGQFDINSRPIYKNRPRSVKEDLKAALPSEYYNQLEGLDRPDSDFFYSKLQASFNALKDKTFTKLQEQENGLELKKQKIEAEAVQQEAAATQAAQQTQSEREEAARETQSERENTQRKAAAEVEKAQQQVNKLQQVIDPNLSPSELTREFLKQNTAPKTNLQKKKKALEQLAAAEVELKNAKAKAVDAARGYYPEEEAKKLKLKAAATENKFYEEAAKTKGELPPGAEYGFTGLPNWMGGPFGALRMLEERARAESQTPYQPYPGQRVALPSALQTIAEEEIARNYEDPKYEELFNLAQENLLKSTEKPAYQDIDKYMNPYQEKVLDTLEKRLNRNLFQNILPNIGSNYISKGMYQTGDYELARDRAIRDANEAYAQQAGQLLAQGYEGAISTAQSDLSRKMAGAQGLHGMKSKELEDVMQNIDLLDKLGSRERATNQAKLDAEYNEFVQQQNYRPTQTARYSELVRGLQPSLGTETYRVSPVQPQASPWQTGAGIAMQAYGMHQQNRQKNAKGGHIRHLLAEGGAPFGALPAEVDYEQRLQAALQQLGESGRNPMYDYIGRMGASLAGSQNPNFMGALGAASEQGYNAAQETMNENRQRPLQALSFSKLLAEGQRSAADREYKYKLDEENRELNNLLKLTPKISEDWKLNELGEPVIARKVNGIIQSINGMPLGEGRFSNEEQSLRDDMSLGDMQEPEQRQDYNIPLSNIRSQKLTSPFEEKERLKHRIALEAKESETIKEDLDAAQQALDAAEVLEAQQGKYPAGLLSGVAKKASEIKGILPGTEGEWAASMQMIENAAEGIIAPKLKNYKPIANAELQFLLRNAPNASDQPTAFKNKVALYKAAATRLQDKTLAKSEWLKTGKPLQEFETLWSKYANNFRLVDTNQDINKKNFKIDSHDNWGIIFDPNFENMPDNQKQSPSQSRSIDTPAGIYSIDELKAIAQQ